MERAADYLKRPPPGGFDLGIHAFCKINLGLRVGARRPDRYHEILTIFQTLDFADTIYARPRSKGFRLRVVREGPARGRGLSVPAGPGNLVLRAARLAGRALGESRGAEFLLIKRVPAGSGLGGGSSDAAAALRLVARLWGRRLPLDRRRKLADELGSDCAFFIRGGRAVARGRGERLVWRKISETQRVLLALPRRGVPTAHAYRLLDQSKHLTPIKTNLSLPSPLHTADSGSSARSLMPNELEEVVCRQYPEVARARELLELQGVAAIQMSGSGSAVYGIVSPGIASNILVPKQHRQSPELVLSRFARVGSRWCRAE
jgi:4-diphosphocytidyl-2-C-methyl-D-erythritol kinase